jgi:hypothetical protein
MKIIFLIPLFVLIACAPQKKEMTKTKIRFTQSFSAEFPGGAYLFLRQLSSGKVMSKKLTTTSFEGEFENGDYDILVSTWDGAQLFTGAIQCGVAKKQSLTGGEKSISITVSEASCADPLFGPIDSVDASGSIKPLAFHSCADIKPYLDAGERPSPGSFCFYDEAGKARSYQVAMFEYDLTTTPFADRKNPTWSSCVSASSIDEGGLDPNTTGETDSYVDSDFRILMGSNGLRIPYVIKAYDGQNCSEGGAHEIYQFKNGLYQLAENNKAVTVLGSSYSNDVYLDSFICSGAWLTNAPFAEGTTPGMGLASICTANQLANLADYADQYLTVLIRRDLDLTGMTSMIGTEEIPFIGQVFGNNKKLFNYNISSSSDHVGLFAYVSDYSRFENLRIENFDVTSTASTAIASGALIGTLIGNVYINNEGGGDYYSLGLDRFTAKNIKVTAKNGAVGGIIGKIFADGGNPELRDINLENVIVNNADYEFISGSDSTGGLLASFVGQLNSVSNTTGRLSVRNINSNGINIYATTSGVGLQYTGGLIGSVGHSLIQDSSNVQVERVRLTNLNMPSVGSYSGGLVGSAITQNYTDLGRIDLSDISVQGNVTINLGDGATSDVGGLIGLMMIGHIRDGVANLTINSTNNNQGSYAFGVGGIAGTLYNSNFTEGTNECLSHIYLDGVKANVTLQVDGNSLAGIAGNTTCTTITNALAVGSISSVNTSPSQTYLNWGGITGIAKGNSSISKVIAKMTLTGFGAMGGIVGTNFSNIYAAYFEGNINSIKASDLINTEGIGGIVGVNKASGNISDIEIGTGQVKLENDVINGEEFVGNVIGYNLNTYAIGSYHLALNDIYKGAIKKNSSICGSDSSACIADFTSFISLSECLSNSCNESWDLNGSTWGLSFQKQWSSFSTNLAGNRAEPFILNSVADWNKVGGNEFLLSRSYRLGVDIDFGSSAFIPFGGDPDLAAMPFRGTLIPNKKKLKNISYPIPTSEGWGHGVIRYAQNATIGDYNDPLNIEGLKIDLGNKGATSVGGMVGYMSEGRVHAHIKNLSIFNGGVCATSPCYGIGGLVGRLDGFASIAYSGVSGSINLSKEYHNVGGLIGEVNYLASTGGNNYNSIRASYASVNITAGDVVGGFIGHIANELNIERSYNYTASVQCLAANCNAASFIHTKAEGYNLEAYGVYSATVNTLTHSSTNKNAIAVVEDISYYIDGFYYHGGSVEGSTDDAIKWDRTTNPNEPLIIHYWNLMTSMSELNNNLDGYYDPWEWSFNGTYYQHTWEVDSTYFDHY